MVKKASLRRLAENESYFRESNNSVLKGIDEMDRIADEDGAPRINIDRDAILQFCCECSDETCKKRIKLSLNEYSKVHSKNNQFSIACGHDVPSIEDVIFTGPNYCIVKKHQQPPKSATHLNKTPIKN